MLDSDTLRLLRDGGPDGSRTAFQLALRFLNHGWGYDAYRGAMTDPTNGAARWYFDLRDGRAATSTRRRKTARGPERAELELRRCWDKVSRLPAARPLDVSDVYQRCEQAWAHASAKLTGKGRSTRLRVLAAVIAEAKHYETTRVLCPLRTIAVAAGVSKDTTASSLRDLVRVGVLRRVGAETEARVYEVCRVGQTCPTHGVWSLSGLAHLDVFHATDLGSAAALLYAALHDEPATRRELAEITGLHRTTVARRLPDLVERGLAVEVDGSWLRGPADPRTASRFPTGQGPGERNANRYADERAQRRRARFTVAASEVATDVATSVQGRVAS
jgi:DNA-binding Lrp family transcriptional regulator